MNKVLTIIAAFTLCGTAFGKDIYTSSKNDGQSLVLYGDEYELPVTLHVDKTVKFNNIDLFMSSPNGSLSLCFYGANFVNATGWLAISEIVSITGDKDGTAAAYWSSQLVEADGIATITLMSGDGSSAPNFASSGVSFMGASAGESVTLGAFSLEYVGSFESIAKATARISDNQIAIVSDYSTTQLALVGKISPTPATPEPATATLSLLALAGLCARRRRK